MAAYNPQKLYQALCELAVVPKSALDRIYNQSIESGADYATKLVYENLISDENLGKVIADLSSFHFIRLSEVTISDDILHIIPEVVAKKNAIISFRKDASGLHVAMSDPNNLELIEFIKKKVGYPVIVYYATPSDINNSVALYHRNFSESFEAIISQNLKKLDGSPKAEAEPPIIKIVDAIISYANQNKASDIHIEPLENDCLVRFRIDGILHDVVKMPLNYHPQIVTRIKVISQLRLDEHQSAQDGKIKLSVENEHLDIRVSVVPITRGEKIVLRLLSEKSRHYSLADLGISQSDLLKIQRAYGKPFGMLLSTGPTGCGKTTTLYSILKLLNARNRNIMTIEDPVEYDIEGVNQIQVNIKTNLTFSAGLRAIVRQDPNIILVGEIRDEETAGIAINSAMTGHLVLSSLHTNDAATTIPRLIEMKVEPFLIASSINIIIGQRLVRRICLRCRISLEVDRNFLLNNFSESLVDKYFGQDAQIRLYKGKGCEMCHSTGYEGRIGIFEVMEINDSLRASIVDRKDSSIIKRIAQDSGMIGMVEDGLSKVRMGITSIDEILRVIKE